MHMHVCICINSAVDVSGESACTRTLLCAMSDVWERRPTMPLWIRPLQGRRRAQARSTSKPPRVLGAGAGALPGSVYSLTALQQQLAASS
jgi:hypothetical protein